MKTNLKPCPFCGSKAELHFNEFYVESYEVICSKQSCACSVAGFEEKNAVKLWNTRHDELTFKKFILLIFQIAIYGIALAILAGGVWSIFN